VALIFRFYFLFNFFTLFIFISLIYKIIGIKWDLDIFELMILIFAGTIRGAVAFALVLIMTGENASLLQVTTYINLMVSTIFMGAAMPHLLKIILSARDRMYPERALSNQNEISELQNQDRTQSLLPNKHKKSTRKSNILHAKWRRLDDEYLKPFFIYNYHEVKAEIDYQHRLSINEIYRVEFNNNAMDYRNPLPYSIKEIDISQIISKEAKEGVTRKNKTYGHVNDLDLSIEQKRQRLRKSDGDLEYQLYQNRNRAFEEMEMNNQENESLSSPRKEDENREEYLRKQYYREKIKNERVMKNKKKKSKKSAHTHSRRGEDSSINKGDGNSEDGLSNEEPEEKKDNKN